MPTSPRLQVLFAIPTPPELRLAAGIRTIALFAPAIPVRTAALAMLAPKTGVPLHSTAFASQRR